MYIIISKIHIRSKIKETLNWKLQLCGSLNVMRNNPGDKITLRQL